MERAALACFALIACTHHAPVCDERDAISFDRCIGHALDQVMMTASWREVDDPVLARYVSAVGTRVVHAAGDHQPWTFRVLDDPDVEGEANLDTTVYVTRGALARLRDEAELAGLLAHEIAHVLVGHGHDAIIEHSRDLADPVEAVRARDDEIQADELGVLLAARAGYDPRAYETMLRALAAGDGPGDPDDVHPPWLERVTRARAVAVQLPARGDRNPEAYVKHVRGLVVGLDPRVAWVQGDTVILARTGVAIDLPHGTHGTISGDEVSFDLAGAAVVIEPTTRELARYLKPTRKPGMVTEVRTAPRGAVMISVAAATPEQAQRALVLRAPRAEELARIHPQLVDLDAPRKLWPE